MSVIDIDELGGQMVAAAANVLQVKSQAALDLAKVEFPKIARAIVFIEGEYAKGRMSDKEARLHLRLQKNVARTALLAVEGLELIAVQSAINAALGAIRDVVNTALGFALV